MQELPSVFSKTGAFQPLPSEQMDLLDDQRRASYTKLEQAAENLKAADDAVAQSIVSIKQAHDAVVEHEKFMTANFPKREFHDLWRETFKS